MPTITIGRIVHFRTENGRVFPAIVTDVHSDDLVNLRVFEDSHDFPWETSVQKQDETEGASIENQRWFWPPRVKDTDAGKGQAAS